MTQIKVSILCNTHNHEAYIASAIEGFLMQKTDFATEICIHDDASTDKTPDILRSYEAQYPTLIKVIYQDKNQYAQGKLIMEINSARASGEYLAVCDGDDTWIDPLKLQKQVVYLDDHPECSMVISAHVTQSSGFPYLRKTIQVFPQDKTITLDEIFGAQSLRFVYSTFMFRRKDLTMPEVFRTLRFTDLPRIIYSALIGEVRYISTPMTLYRTGVFGSLSMKQVNDQQQRINALDQLSRFYRDLDEVTQGQHKALFTQQTAFCALQKAVIQGDLNTFRQVASENKIPYLTPRILHRMEIKMKHPKLASLYNKFKLKHWR